MLCDVVSLGFRRAYDDGQKFVMLTVDADLVALEAHGDGQCHIRRGDARVVGFFLREGGWGAFALVAPIRAYGFGAAVLVKNFHRLAGQRA